MIQALISVLCGVAIALGIGVPWYRWMESDHHPWIDRLVDSPTADRIYRRIFRLDEK